MRWLWILAPILLAEPSQLWCCWGDEGGTVCEYAGEDTDGDGLVDTDWNATSCGNPEPETETAPR